MSPVYYRYEHDKSRARYREGLGIWAEAKRWVPFYPGNNWEQQGRLEEELLAHLDWYNGSPTVFISTSSDREWVFQQAEDRCDEGKTNVKVYQITVPLEHYRVHFASVKELLERVNSRVPWYAQFRSTRNEYLFLHHIPEDWITGRWAIENGEAWPL